MMAKRKEVLLINPPMDYNSIRREYSFEAYLPPLGLLYIATPLEKIGCNVKLIDFVAEKFTEEKLQKAMDKTDVICITVTSQVAASASKLTDFIKKINPRTTIVIGGPHCTLQGKQALADIKADISISGDGEGAIVEVLDALNGEKDLANIRGVFYKENGVIKEGLPGKEIEDLDSIEFPSRHLIKKYTYGKDIISGVTFFARGRITSIATTRGCPFRCRFCVSKAITKKYRLRSAENVAKELEEISKEYDSVFVVDDNFLSNKKRSHKIMDLLNEKKLNLDIWIAGIRITDADKELFKKMKRAGVKSIEFGIESGNQEVLDYYDKKITLEEVRNAIKLSKKAGFLTIGNFILGSPIETDSHINDSIKFAKELNLDFAFFNPYFYLKGSEIWEEAFKQGKIKENETFVPCDSRRGLGNFTPEELRERLIKSYKSFYLNPRFLLSQLIRQIFVYKNFRVFQAGLKIYLEQKDRNILAR